MRSKGNAGAIVSGPGTEGRPCETLLQGVVVAQNRAIRANAPGTWYVRRPEGGKAVYAVERREDGFVYTTKNGGH